VGAAAPNAIGAALIEIMQIKYLGFAVGSKVVAFRNPQIAAV
jgi:hypothetical protein